MNLLSILSIIAGVIALVVFGLIFSFISVWVKAYLNGARVSLINLDGMRFGGVPYSLVVDARITAVKAGIELTTDEIAAHFLAGGNVIPTVQALIAANKAGIKLDWRTACAIDLATKGTGKTVTDGFGLAICTAAFDQNGDRKCL